MSLPFKCATANVRASAMAQILGVALLISNFAVHADDAASPKPETAGFDLSRPEIAAFVNRVVARDGLQRDWVISVLGAATVRPELIPAMDHPAETELAWWQ